MNNDISSIQSDYIAAKTEQNRSQIPAAFQVRQLMPDDAQKFREIRLEAITKTNLFVSLFAGDPEVPPSVTEAKQPLSVWRELLTPSDSSSYFGVFDGEELIAIGKAYSDPGNVSKKTLGLGAGYVSDAYRKQGIITLLFNGIVEWAKDKNYGQIVCQCRMDNEPIKNFLRKNGFVQTGTEQGRMCSGEIVEGFRMERPLDISSPAQDIVNRETSLDKSSRSASSPSPS